jgi:hypothetical protein
MQVAAGIILLHELSLNSTAPHVLFCGIRIGIWRLWRCSAAELMDERFRHAIAGPRNGTMLIDRHINVYAAMQVYLHH